MTTSVIGYPRIGALRELKFAQEAFFKGQKSAEELLALAKDLRKTHWTTQKDHNIDFISSNDFSFYDGTLDTAVLFNILPERYAKSYQILRNTLQQLVAIKEQKAMLKHLL